ncbi:MAG: YtxH domain-containing protein [Bacteroidaceae bacterium]|nr:YtxH domain-containing protein [Bacteroidaceae bacterium]
MSLGSSKFWVGMLIGSVAGAMIYRCCQSGKAKEWKEKMCSKMSQMRHKAEEILEEGKKKAIDAGVKIADSVAEKAEENRNRAHSFANNNK